MIMMDVDFIKDYFFVNINVVKPIMNIKDVMIANGPEYFKNYGKNSLAYL